MMFNLVFITLFVIGSTFSGTNDNSFTISGTIYDKEFQETLPFAYVHLEELNRTAVADIDGYFELNNIPEGDYTLSFHRMGFKTQKRYVEVTNNLTLKIELTPSPLTAETIEVIGVNNELTGANVGHVSKTVSGSTLRRDLGATLANTLSNVPGIDQRSLGNSTSRPVIRGLGDERVIILQDGLTTGDVSGQSSDHAVSVDPMASSEIQIAKGANALQYGANAVGGIINLVNNTIATNIPNTATGSFTIGGESVNRSGFSGINYTFPVNKFVVNAQLSGRAGNETQTPTGVIENTNYTSSNNLIGISYITNHGYFGGSTGYYFNNYGIPPDPNGHTNGVDIEMHKFSYALKGEFLPSSGFIKTIETDFSINNYNHKEFEGNGVLGTEFGLVTTSAQANFTHGEVGIFHKGNFGASAEMEDYAVFGASTPDANSYNVASYIIEEVHLKSLVLEAGLRFDYVINSPKQANSQSNIGNIRTREFPALSGSLNLIYDLGDGFSVGTILLHSFRAPSLEELYSEGPHLASFSYEIGNPELDPERSLAKEVFTRWQGNNSYFEVALFHNQFSNFIFAQNTGTPNSRFPTLNNYQFVGNEALLYGFEISTEFEVINNIVLEASTSYTHAQQEVITNGVSTTKPLPQIPPLKVKGAIKYSKNAFNAGTKFQFANKQTRLGEFETKTDSYFLTDIFTQYRFDSKSLLHTISLNINNIFDTEYYNHLSRIKDIRPEPGRNISLLYKVYF